MDLASWSARLFTVLQYGPRIARGGVRWLAERIALRSEPVIESTNDRDRRQAYGIEQYGVGVCAALESAAKWSFAAARRASATETAKWHVASVCF